MELQLLDYGTLLVFLTTAGVTQATKEPKIFRKIESGLSVGGVSVQNVTAKSETHCSIGFVLCTLVVFKLSLDRIN